MSAINRALEASGYAEDFGSAGEQVRRDEELLPWELGDQDARMERVMEQTGAWE